MNIQAEQYLECNNIYSTGYVQTLNYPVIKLFHVNVNNTIVVKLPIYFT